MQPKINQIFGGMAEVDLQVYKLTLDLESSTEKEAIEAGWLLFNNEWYNSRSTRIDVEAYGKRAKAIKNYTVTYQEHIEDYSEIHDVFNIFVAKRNLSASYNIESDKERASWILVRNSNNKLVAFSKMINYDKGLETQFTALDYSDPRASIGTKLLGYEIDLARTKGLKHLYLGSGYGAIAVYKSSFRGFEWWTGSEWSSDVNKYNEICRRDDSIKTLQDLSGLLNGLTENT